MSALLQCLLRACFEDTPENESDNDSYLPPHSNRMIRLFQSTPFSTTDQSSNSYRPAGVSDLEDNDGAGEGDDNNICCRTNDSEGRATNTTTTATTTTTTTNNTVAATVTAPATASSTSASSVLMSESNSHAAGLRQFWRAFRERLNFDGIDSFISNNTSIDSERQKQEKEKQRDERVPILTQASSFDASKEVPTILSEHIVLPGSDLQLQMAKAMAARLGDHDDECVICMEGFEETNPRMPTLCGCGTNKTYFHLPCLYQWIDQDRNCPSCRKRLRWEEF